MAELLRPVSSGTSRRWRAAAATAAAGALAMAALVLVRSNVGVGARLQLQGAALPRYSPAALALARSQKEVAGIVQREARGTSAAAKGKHSENEMAGGTALTKKQLARIVGAARAAAQKNNQLIFAADGALAASQKELGKDAVKVPIYVCVCVHSIEMSLRAHTHDVDTRYRSFR